MFKDSLGLINTEKSMSGRNLSKWQLCVCLGELHMYMCVPDVLHYAYQSYSFSVVSVHTITLAQQFNLGRNLTKLYVSFNESRISHVLRLKR